ncbi:MAG: PLP-dependent transferase, partial [Pseudomonadota bacterium]
MNAPKPPHNHLRRNHLSRNSSWRPATLAAQGLGFQCPETAAIVPPIHLSTTFARDETYSRPDDRGYIRDDGAAFEQPEQLIARLEGGFGAALFPSGMSACHAVLTAGGAGRIAVQQSVYFGVGKMLEALAPSIGLEVVSFPNGDLEAIERIVRTAPTRLVWIETPSNPLAEICDIAAVAAITRPAGTLLCVDSTLATPILTKPIEFGADLVCHSATKYLNGHSDVLMGVLVSASDSSFWQKILEYRYLTGQLPGAFACFLLTRGLRTLALRVERQSANALAIARFMERHSAIERVSYAGLEHDPGHQIASKQMQGGYGGLIALYVADGPDRAVSAICRLQLIKRATSLGGVESLI